MKNFKDIIVLLTVFALIGAWLIGNNRKDANIQSFVIHVLPDIDSVQQITDKIYQCSQKSGDRQILIGHVAFGQADGFSGPMLIAVGIDTLDSIFKIKIIEHKETIAFLQKTRSHNFLTHFSGRYFNDPLLLSSDIEAVSGATLSSNAIIICVQEATRLYAEKIKNQKLPYYKQNPFIFSFKDIALLLLFLLSYLIYSKRFKHRRRLYWVSLLLSLVIIGFIYASLLSLTNIIAFSIGFWPDIQSNIYWYLLFALTFLPIIFEKKNIYCYGICPFGAAQECLGSIGKARRGFSLNIHKKLIWMPRLLAIIFIGLGFLQQNPGIESHEVFSAFFNLTGTNFQFILLAIIVIASLFIKRPWCNYLCPIRGITDFLHYLRKRAYQIVNLKKTKLYSNS